MMFWLLACMNWEKITDVDLDGDGITVEDGDCWDGPEGPVGSGLSGANIHPGAEDIACDGIDQNCDNADDFDQDGDGDIALQCTGTDCDDTDATINSAATEIWYDGIDQACDGDNDNDADGDGVDSSAYGGTDCNDSDPSVFPGTTENCATDYDDNCDGLSNTLGAENGMVFYIDMDGDGVGDINSTSQIWCASGDAASHYTATVNTDCDDTDASDYPGAVETVANGDDEDCDGTELCYKDEDDDGYRPDSVSTKVSVDLDCSDSGEAFPTDPTTDCNDTSSIINPTGTEVCDTVNADENCDGVSDDADLNVLQSSKGIFYVDMDFDGYGERVTTHCDPAPGIVNQSGDCDDGNAAISPGDPEICDPLDVDEDCDGVADDLDSNVTGKTTYYRDADGDSYGVATNSVQQCSQPAGYETNNTDCLDTDVQSYPGATEWCDGHVNDCNNSGTWTTATENGLVTWINGSTYTDISSQWSGDANYQLPMAGTINVCEGTYNVHLTTVGNTSEINIDIVGYNAPVITSSTSGALLQVYNTAGLNHQVRVYDMTFTGGVGSNIAGDVYGGNIAVYDDDENYATDVQGQTVQLLLDGCTVSGGTAMFGGGISVGIWTVPFGHVKLVDTVVSGNGGASTIQGGGIFISMAGQLICENSDIISNLATLNSNSKGGAIFYVNSSDYTTSVISTGCDWGTGATENFARSSLIMSDIEGSALNPYNISGVQTTAFTCTGTICQ